MFLNLQTEFPQSNPVEGGAEAPPLDHSADSVDYRVRMDPAPARFRYAGNICAR